MERFTSYARVSCNGDFITNPLRERDESLSFLNPRISRANKNRLIAILFQARRHFKTALMYLLSIFKITLRWKVEIFSTYLRFMLSFVCPSSPCLLSFFFLRLVCFKRYVNGIAIARYFHWHVLFTGRAKRIVFVALFQSSYQSDCASNFPGAFMHFERCA